MFISFNGRRNRLIKGIIVLITLVFFTCFSCLPIQAFPENKPLEYRRSSNHFHHSTPSEAGQTRNDKMPLLLSYGFDKEQGILQLGWNRDQNTDQRFFIFKKGLQDSEYKLAGDPAGVGGNSFQDKLSENYGVKYVICQLREGSKLPKDFTISKLTGLGGFEERLKAAQSIYCISNEIVVDVSDGVCPRPSSLAGCRRDQAQVSLSWKPGDADIQEYLVYRREPGSGPCWYQFTNRSSIVDPEIPHDDGLIYYIWGFDASGNAGIPMVYYLPGEPGGKKQDAYGEIVPGVYRLKGNSASKIQFQGLSLSIPVDAAPTGSIITINPLADGQIPNLPASVPNFTAGEGSTVGYEVLLNGDSANKFQKDIQISLKYDKTKLGKGASEKSIFVYYSDAATGKWNHLKRKAIDTQNGVISCSTNHFCEFYAGTMAMSSEPPPSKGLNTNPANIKPVDPMSGLLKLSPPAPNNQGTANLSYPITVPEGINQLTPQIAVNYTSGQGENNCGYGWRLGTSAIITDTKNGVPKYDGQDKLFWDGRELVSMMNGVYRCKVEGVFAKVVKENNGFTVYQTNGSKMIYGADTNSRLEDPDNPNRVFAWFLKTIVDNFGNTVTYDYEPRYENDRKTNTYLSHVYYGFKNGDRYAYNIDFLWEDRSDIRLNGRSGFIIKDTRRLSQILINYQNTTPLKQYKFEYISGAFGKGLLKAIVEKNGSGATELNRTTFDYDTAIGKYFSDTVTWPRPNCSFAPFGEEGLRYSYLESTGTEHTEIDFVDFNGDGLPDRVAKQRDNGNFYVQYNTGSGFTNTYVIPVPTALPPLCESGRGKEDLRYTYGDGSKQHTEVDFVDFNGDGLPDRVQKHRDNGFLQVQLNTGKSFMNTLRFTLPTTPPFCTVGSPNLRFNWADGGKLHTEIDFFDFNGDGKPDRVNKQRESSYFRVQYNTGNGFSDTDLILFNNNVSYWFGSQDIRYTYNEDTKSHVEIDTVDFNGDGLPDRVAKQRDTAGGLVYVQLNTGHGFTDAVSMPSDSLVYGEQDLRYIYKQSGKHQEVDFIDINGDGLPDRVGKQRSSNNFYIDLNNGSGFLPCLQAPVTPFNVSGKESLRYIFSDPSTYKQYTVVDFADVNGDGLPDRVVKDKTDNNFYIQFNQLGNKNLLRKVTTADGAEINFDYQRVFLDPDRNVTRNYAQKNVLSSISSGKPGLLMTTTAISYENGIYDRVEKEFRGFQKVTTRVFDKDTGGTLVSETTYHVTDKDGGKDPLGLYDTYDQYLKGQVDTIIRSESFASGPIANVILHKEKYEYQKVDVLAGNRTVKFVYPALKRVWIYNTDVNNNNYRFMGKDESQGDISESCVYRFNTEIGLTQQIVSNEYNDPYHANDDVTTITDYTISGDSINWRCLPYQVEKKDLLTGARIMFNTTDYNARNAPQLIKNWNNIGTAESATVFEYDNPGNIIKMTGPDGHSDIKTVTYPMNEIYMETVDSNSNDGLVETNRFDSYGRLREKVNGYGQKNIFSYDDWGRLCQVQEEINGSLLTTRRFTYGNGNFENNQPYYMAQGEYLNDPATNDFLIVQYFSDALGRQIQIKTEAVVNGTKCWVVSGKSEYDQMGRVVKTGSAFTVPFDANDRSLIPLQMKDPAMVSSYDKLGRETETIAPSGFKVAKNYETILDTGSYQRILFKTTIRTSDNLGNLVQEQRDYTTTIGQKARTERLKKNGTLLTTNYDIDLHGGTVVTEGAAGKVEKQADSLGRMTWTRTPDAGKKEYTYDDRGRLTVVTEKGKNETDSSQRLIQYQYDDANHLLKIDYDGANEDVTFDYYSNTETNLYARSKIKSVNKGIGFSVQYNYGGLWSEEVKTIDGTSYKTRYEYDVMGRVAKVTYPDGEVTCYSYNEGGKLQSVTGAQSYIIEIQYDQYGQRTSVKYGNGTVMNYNYNNTTRNLDRFTTYDRNGQELLRYDYNFDALGNVTTIRDNPYGSLRSEQTYQYDSFSNRLAGSTGKYYDAGGNLQSYTGTFDYDDDNRFVQKTLNGSRNDYRGYLPGTHAPALIVNSENGVEVGKITVNYDDFGNMTGKIYSGQNQNQSKYFSYDQNNRLTMVTGNMLQLQFAYDNEGQRYKKTYGDGVATIKETIFVNGLYTVSAGETSKHISDGEHVIATKTNNQAASILYYHLNHIGSTTLITDAGGAKNQFYLYYPYGEPWISENQGGSNTVTRLFTGQEYDQESGLYYYNARYYDPGLGVFISPDPVLDGLNSYAYGANNPVTYIDPTGNFIIFSIGPSGLRFGISMGVTVGVSIGWGNGFSAGVFVGAGIGIGPFETSATVGVSYGSVGLSGDLSASCGMWQGSGIYGFNASVGYNFTKESFTGGSVGFGYTPGPGMGFSFGIFASFGKNGWTGGGVSGGVGYKPGPSGGTGFGMSTSISFGRNGIHVDFEASTNYRKKSDTMIINMPGATYPFLDNRLAKLEQDNPDRVKSVNNAAQLSNLLNNLPKGVKNVILAGAHGSMTGAEMGDQYGIVTIQASSLTVHNLSGVNVYISSCNQGNAYNLPLWQQYLPNAKVFGDIPSVSAYDSLRMLQEVAVLDWSVRYAYPLYQFTQL